MGTQFTIDQYSLAYPDGIERHHWHLARNRIVLEEIRRAGGAGARVLDIGAGRGIAVRHLRDAGIDCLGVELARMRPLEGVEGFIRYGCGAADLAKDERTGYEIILLLDVIEHLDDPAAFIGDLRAIFPRCGLFIITVPACPGLWSNYDEFYGHRRRYTPDMIRALAGETGLAVLDAGFFFRLFYLPARLASALGRKRRCEVKAPRGLWRPIHRAIAAVSVMEYRTLPKNLPGTSIIATLAGRGTSHSHSIVAGGFDEIS